MTSFCKSPVSVFICTNLNPQTGTVVHFLPNLIDLMDDLHWSCLKSFFVLTFDFITQCCVKCSAFTELFQYLYGQVEMCFKFVPNVCL